MCFRADKNATTKAIDIALAKMSKNDLNQLKILLLGTGESGKSTIIKQMQIIYNNGYENDSDRIAFKTLVYQNILRSTKAIADAMDLLKLGGVEDKSLEDAMWDLFEKDEDVYNNLSSEDLTLYRKLWADKGFQKAYSMRHEYQLSDSTSYFFERLDEVAKAEYVPNVQDVLRARKATSGIHEFIFVIDKAKKIEFKMLDVGGQRSERRKWIHCFEQITAVIFIVGSSEYDQVLFETADSTEKINRMTESVALFEQIINYYWFIKTSFVLFLNKEDLLHEKIKHSNIKDYFPDFAGDSTNIAHVKKFITKMYHDVKPNTAVGKELSTHFTTAIATNLIEVTIVLVNKSLVQKHLAEYALME